MSVEVHVNAVGVRVPLARMRVKALAADVVRAERVRHAELSYTFVTRHAIATLNRRHLGHRGPTDIITFEFAAVPGGPVGGDVYIAPEVAREHAARFGRPAREELARLVVHGALHAIGYTHPEDGSRETSAMWRRQERYLVRFYARPEPAPA
ncbi:endoribonuclease YbeY [Gemmatimonadetes bacterium T265]|nr:endoribonuclease YbeY [Gemmatimonadetes bacterium T265]